jgi:uncharacterized membrane protein YbhN (UPF0104 family)
VLDVDSKVLAILLLLMLGSHLQRTFEFNCVLRRLRVREPFIDGFLLNGAALLLNYLPFNAGSVTRAVVLRHRHSLPYAQYVSALMVAAVMNAEVAAACGLVASLHLAAVAGVAAPLVAFFGALTLGGAIALSIPGSWMPTGKSFLARQLGRLVDGVTLIRDGGVGLVPLAVTSAVKLALNTLRLWVCFHALGVDLSATTAILLGSAVLTVSLVNVVPGNIGLREIVLGSISGVAGGSPVLGMAAASLERAVTLGYTILAGLPGVYYVRRIERLTHSRKSVSH